MNPLEAIKIAESWTHDLRVDGPEMPLFSAMKALLDHVKRQDKDIEELTQACRVLFKRNKELERELRRSKAAGD